MTDIVSLIERMAASPYGDPECADAFAALDTDVREAFEGGDAARLALALGGRPFMACMVATPDQDNPEPADAPAEEEPVDPDA